MTQGKHRISRAPRRATWRATCLAAALVVAGLTGPTAAAPAQAAVQDPVLVASDAETVPVAHSGDAMDDPAVWVDPDDSSRSLLIGNDKQGALETYDLSGNRVQRLSSGEAAWGNVDVRQHVTIGGVTRDLVGASQKGVRFFAVDAATRLLSPVTEDDAPIGERGEGFCMYQSPTTHKVYGFTVTIAGLVRQFQLLDDDADGLLESKTVREFSVGSEAEGCVADDDTGALYVSEENQALWRYGAEPDAGTTRQAVDVLSDHGGQLANDVEGVTVVDQAGGKGYLIVSVQNAAAPNASYFSVYRRGAGNDFVTNFRIADGTSSDDCDRTDGVTAVTAALGPKFPHGMFVCQDNTNDAPGTVGNQDLKMTRLEKILALDPGQTAPQPAPASSDIGFVGASTSDANSTVFTAAVPPGTRTGDALLLFVCQGSDTALSGPGAAWTRLGRAEVDGHVATVWRTVATADDLDGTIRLTSQETYTKVSLTLAAYRGTDPDDPVAAVSGSADPDPSAAHTTPSVDNTVDGAWRVSYWSTRDSATTDWTVPAGEATRATTAGTGGGHVSTLLTDAAAPVPLGTTGGLTATADAEARRATTWTLLLRPGA
jgi:myo-inositol-hexaphosphate 3-phosphohydrolase